VAGERYRLGIVGRLAAQYNIHRLATLVEPMAALALLCLAARVTAPGTRRSAAHLAGLGAFAVWIFIFDGVGNGAVSPGGAAALTLTAVLVTFLLRYPEGPILREEPSGRFRRPVVAAVAVTTTLALTGAPAGALGHVGYDRGLGRVETGLALRRLLPEEAVVAAPPELFWVRALSQRSVIADCKAVPYGGAAWVEYMTRVRALGGPCTKGDSGFRRLSPADIEALQGSYGATHVLLFDDDPKLDYARRHWTLLYEAPPPADGSIHHGLALYALDESLGSPHM
jgi:hypothetical protein